MKKNNVIEIKPGEVEYIYDKPSYKLCQPESPIVEMWTTQYQNFTQKASKIAPEGGIIFVSAGAGIGIANIFTLGIESVTIATNFVCAAALLSLCFNRPELKRNKFEYAIAHYQDLKEYEELFPSKRSVINSPKLRGISENNMRKRVKTLKKVKQNQ